MNTKIVKIGNSKGIRIPSVLLEEMKLDLKEELEIKKENGIITLTPLKKSPRSGWNNAFKKMHESNEDVLEDNIDLDNEEWAWDNE